MWLCPVPRMPVHAPTTPSLTLLPPPPATLSRDLANAASNPHAIYSVEEDGALPFFQHPRTILTDDATAGESNGDLSAVEVRSLLAPLGPHPSVDWRTKGAVTPVKNQGRYGTCWSFAAVENLEGLNFRQGHALQNISNQELIDCCADCQGRSADASFTFMLNNTGGQLDTQDSYPYEGKVSPCSKDGPGKVKSTMKLTTFGRIQDTDGTGNAIVSAFPNLSSVTYHLLYECDRTVLQYVCLPDSPTFFSHIFTLKLTCSVEHVY